MGCKAIQYRRHRPWDLTKVLSELNLFQPWEGVAYAILLAEHTGALLLNTWCYCIPHK